MARWVLSTHSIERATSPRAGRQPGPPRDLSRHAPGQTEPPQISRTVQSEIGMRENARNVRDADERAEAAPGCPFTTSVDTVELAVNDPGTTRAAGAGPPASRSTPRATGSSLPSTGRPGPSAAPAPSATPCANSASRSEPACTPVKWNATARRSPGWRSKSGPGSPPWPTPARYWSPAPCRCSSSARHRLRRPRKPHPQGRSRPMALVHSGTRLTSHRAATASRAGGGAAVAGSARSPARRWCRVRRRGL